MKILNHPVPPAFRESVKVGEQNLYTRAKDLVGDRDPAPHEFSIQLRPFDADKSGAGLGLPVLAAMTGALLERSTRGGTIIVGPLNLGRIAGVDCQPSVDRGTGGGQASRDATDACGGAAGSERSAGRPLDEDQDRVLQRRGRRGVQGIGRIDVTDAHR